MGFANKDLKASKPEAPEPVVHKILGAIKLDEDRIKDNTMLLMNDLQYRTAGPTLGDQMKRNPELEHSVIITFDPEQAVTKTDQQTLVRETVKFLEAQGLKTTAGKRATIIEDSDVEGAQQFQLTIKSTQPAKGLKDTVERALAALADAAEQARQSREPGR